MIPTPSLPPAIHLPARLNGGLRQESFGAAEVEHGAVRTDGVAPSKLHIL